jgi:hypothetical protein
VRLPGVDRRRRRAGDLRAERRQRRGDPRERVVGWGDRAQAGKRAQLLGESPHVLEPEAAVSAARAHSRDPPCGRSVAIASNASATAVIRPASGIASSARPRG